MGFVVGIDVGARAGDEDIHLAFENVVGGGAVVAFAEKNVAFVDDALHHRAAVEFEKSSGDAFEDGQLQHLLRLDGEAFADLLADYFFVGERAGGTGDHALAATHARRAAHGIVHVEGDASVVAFALASDDEVVAQIRAGAHAAVAQNAGGVIDQNGERRIVLAAADFAHRIARVRDAIIMRQFFQFAIGGALLADARRGMVGDQHLQQSLARLAHRLAVSADHHAGIGAADAGGGVGALVDIHYAHAANADGRFILLVAKNRNVDAVHARGIENRGAGGNGDFFAVNGEGDGTGRCARIGHQFLSILQTPAGQRPLTMCSSTSWAKCLSTDSMGAGTICPKPQMEVCFRAWQSSPTMVISWSPYLP